MKNRTRFLTVLSLLIIVLMMCCGALAENRKSLYPGDEGTDVQELQQMLIDLKFLKGKADGKYGDKTENAIRAFQKKYNLSVDGVAGQKTRKKLASLTAKSSEKTETEQTADSQSLFGGNYSTIKSGSEKARVKILQQALKDLKYYTGKVDGKYGSGTRKAVKKFQEASKLTADGLAGKKTLKALEKAVKAEEKKTTDETEKTNDTQSLFGGDYSTIKSGSEKARVKLLQQALKDLKYYTGKIDGKYGSGTKRAVKKFQEASKLTADGLAGKKTLKALEKAVKAADEKTPEDTVPTTEPEDKTPAEPEKQPTGTVTPPAKSEIKLLHWFDDIKPNLKNGQQLTVYDPATGYSWKLRLYSLGRHADSEPLTLQDTQNMVAAFGGVNTWNQKAVYVKLPNGTWTIAATHDMPHLSGSIKDNGFDGHLCVHFLRDMSEAEKNDPSYGVANQKTIREAWKKLTGEEIAYK